MSTQFFPPQPMTQFQAPVQQFQAPMAPPPQFQQQFQAPQQQFQAPAQYPQQFQQPQQQYFAPQQYPQPAPIQQRPPTLFSVVPYKQGHAVHGSEYERCKDILTAAGGRKTTNLAQKGDGSQFSSQQSAQWIVGLLNQALSTGTALPTVAWVKANLPKAQVLSPPPIVGGYAPVTGNSPQTSNIPPMNPQTPYNPQTSHNPQLPNSPARPTVTPFVVPRFDGQLEAGAIDTATRLSLQGVEYVLKTLLVPTVRVGDFVKLHFSGGVVMHRITRLSGETSNFIVVLPNNQQIACDFNILSGRYQVREDPQSHIEFMGPTDPSAPASPSTVGAPLPLPNSGSTTPPRAPSPPLASVPQQLEHPAPPAPFATAQQPQQPQQPSNINLVEAPQIIDEPQEEEQHRPEPTTWSSIIPLTSTNPSTNEAPGQSQPNQSQSLDSFFDSLSTPQPTHQAQQPNPYYAHQQQQPLFANTFSSPSSIPLAAH